MRRKSDMKPSSGNVFRDLRVTAPESDLDGTWTAAHASRSPDLYPGINATPTTLPSPCGSAPVTSGSK